jgi:hypothetical protein
MMKMVIKPMKSKIGTMKKVVRNHEKGEREP